MEREILFTGIGGQGIQLAARTLAEAAITDGRRVQLFASYGGMMRGGNSDSMLVVADTEITAPPTVGRAWAGVVMHHEHAEAVWSSMRSGGLAVVNGSVVDPDCRPSPDRDITLIDVAALDLATELGAPVAASLVLIGALVAHTELVSSAALLETAARVLPSYRTDAAAVNRRALEVGLGTGSTSHAAWADTAVR